MSNLVSLYISAGSDLQSVRRLIQREQVTSTNVQDRWTRQEVGSALRNLLHYLNNFKEVPPNGLILFASSSGVESIELLVPCRVNMYKCGSEFYRGPLDAMQDEAAGEKYGLIVIDNVEATIAWWRGNTIVPLWHEFGQAMPKTHMGGMSQRRYQRQHDEAVKHWQRKVSAMANEIFIPMGVRKVLVAGPGFRKNSMVDDGKLDYRIEVIGIQDCGYADEIAGPREALARWRKKDEKA